MVLSLCRNLMIRRVMFPRSEGVRLHFINYQTLGFFSALAASSNPLVILNNYFRIYFSLNEPTGESHYKIHQALQHITNVQFQISQE